MCYTVTNGTDTWENTKTACNNLFSEASIAFGIDNYIDLFLLPYLKAPDAWLGIKQYLVGILEF